MKLLIFGFILFLLSKSQCIAGDLENWQQKLYNALKAQGAIASDTQLLRMEFVCALHVNKEKLLIVDTAEIIPDPNTPRGKNQINVLNADLKIIKIFDYANQVPLFCKDNKLFLQSKFAVNNEQPEGNTLNFTPSGDIFATDTDTKNFPIKLTGSRPNF